MEIPYFQALYGRLPSGILHYQIGQSLVHEVDKQMLSRDVLLLLENNINHILEPKLKA
jgi:hypothetical protein